MLHLNLSVTFALNKIVEVGEICKIKREAPAKRKENKDRRGIKAFGQRNDVRADSHVWSSFFSGYEGAHLIYAHHSEPLGVDNYVLHSYDIL